MTKKNVKLTRKTAERIIGEFLERVNLVNKDSDLIYEVTKAVIFGSYLTDKERLGDLDIAVKLERRKSERDRAAWREERVALARSKGRKLQFPQDLWWPQKEVVLILTSNSKAISLHHIDDIDYSNYTVIYELDGR